MGWLAAQGAIMAIGLFIGLVCWLCSEFSVNSRFHDKTVHILRSSEPEAEAEPPPLAARSVLDRLA